LLCRGARPATLSALLCRGARPATLSALLCRGGIPAPGFSHLPGDPFVCLFESPARSLHGTYVSVEPFHLFRYLDEQAFRFNKRHTTDADRFVQLCPNATGRRLTWNQLTGKKYIRRLTEEASAREAQAAVR